MENKIYLGCFDKYADILAYDLARRDFKKISRTDLVEKNIVLNFGFFTEEGKDIFGVYASPDGPVVFLNKKHFLCVNGLTSAKIQDDAGGAGVHEFRLTCKRVNLPQADDDLNEIRLLYFDRLGIGTNPYDQEREDIDPFAMLVQGLAKPQFYKNYTRDFQAY